jgi:hypothetical protein
LIVVPIAQKIADFSMPPWLEAAWKLGVVAVAGTLVALVVGLLSPFLGWIAGGVVFWILMWRWFDVDFRGAIVIAILVRVLAVVVALVALGALAK